MRYIGMSYTVGKSFKQAKDLMGNGRCDFILDRTRLKQRENEFKIAPHREKLILSYYRKIWVSVKWEAPRSGP